MAGAGKDKPPMRRCIAKGLVRVMIVTWAVSAALLSPGLAMLAHAQTSGVRSPVWETWWFIGIIGPALAVATAGVYWLRVRNIEARSRELERRVEQRTHELAALNTIAAVVSRSLDLATILSNALEKTLDVMHMDTGLAYRLEETDGASSGGPLLCLLAHRGVPDYFVNILRSLPLRGTAMERAAGAGKPVVHRGPDNPISRIQEANEREGIRLYVTVPLLVKGKLVGGLTVGAREAREIMPEELSLLAAIGQQVGLAVENARLYKQAEQSATMTERNRLARELHDSVTQSLYSVTLYAEAAAEQLSLGETETAIEHLHELRDTAQEALRDMRLLIFELRPSALGRAGLAAALQMRLDAVEGRSRVQAELQVDGCEALPRTAQVELYNIAQEALNNVIKHAAAHHVQVRLRFDEALTCMQICDDGMGFEPALARRGGGFGISGMEERAQRIGGTLLIDSVPGRGTTVTVQVPAVPAVPVKERPAVAREEEQGVISHSRLDR
jgi:signal transduction histidine kinase